jgi:hypothetical protein
VTALTPLEPLLCELDVLGVPELDDVVAPELEVVAVVEGVEATVVAEDLLASAGSWPETSTRVMNSQLATNRATAPAMTRRRIDLARARRVCLSAWPRARAAAGSLSVMFVYLGGRG